MISKADPDFFEKKDIRHRTIPVEDSVNQDLLQHFRETNEFIHSALTHEARVLVHWLVYRNVSDTNHLILLSLILHCKTDRRIQFERCSGIGVSRSAAICIAYLLYRDSTKLTPDTALSLLQRSRSNCQPNEGFMKQLWLYHQMGCCLDPTDSELYHRWIRERLDALR